MAFWLELEMWCEVVSAIYFGNAGENITVEVLKGLAVDLNLTSTEFWASSRKVINF